jgi:polyhydroxyalkanoate synthesis regulator protein
MVPASDPVTIKLFANRRLYEPRSGRYVTRDERIALAHEGADLRVPNASTGADITRSILSHRRTEH